MAAIMTKQGSRDNIITYEFICDTAADMAAIERQYITLGSVCIVLEDGIEVYIANSNHEWNSIGGLNNNGSGAQLDLHICTSSEVSDGVPNIASPDPSTIYFIAGSENTNDLYTEYMYVNENWEKIGGGSVNLEGYATTTALADKADKADTVLTSTLSRGRADGSTVGTASFAFGNYVTASGSGSHAEGSGTRATDSDAHAEGSGSAATASAAHAEGAGSMASGQMSHAEGAGSTASGTISHAEGSSTLASGVDSHAEGNLTLATGNNSHSEGYYTAAIGDNSHAEGTNTAASGVAAHVEGAAVGSSNANTYIKVTGNANVTTYTFTYPSSPYIEVKAGDYLKNGTTFVSVSSVSGNSVTVSATLSSSKLTNYTVYVYKTRASGYAAHAEGAATIASADFAHAEGVQTTASAAGAHAEGTSTTASGSSSHAEGTSTQATADNAHAEGQNSQATGQYAHAEGLYTIASGMTAHAEGYGGTFTLNDTTYTSGATAMANHSEGYATLAAGVAPGSHAEGMNTIAGKNAPADHAEGHSTQALGGASHSEGQRTITYGTAAHAEGMDTLAYNLASHAEGRAYSDYTIKLTGNKNATSYTFSMTSGSEYLKPGTIILYKENLQRVTSVSGSTITVQYTLSSTENLSNAQAKLCFHVAGGESAHVEGNSNLSLGLASHAEGNKTRADGPAAHAEGQDTVASGDYSHAEGQGTIASQPYCHAEGKYNITPISGILHVVGNGTSSQRSNAYTLDDQGNGWYAGNLIVSGNSLTIGNITITATQLQALLALLN